LTESSFDRKLFSKNAHLTESFFEKWSFDRKDIWPKGRLTECFFWNSRLTEFFFSKIFHLTDCLYSIRIACVPNFFVTARRSSSDDNIKFSSIFQFITICYFKHINSFKHFFPQKCTESRIFKKIILQIQSCSGKTQCFDVGVELSLFEYILNAVFSCSNFFNGVSFRFTTIEFQNIHINSFFTFFLRWLKYIFRIYILYTNWNKNNNKKGTTVGQMNFRSNELSVKWPISVKAFGQKNFQSN
jgi:hypothetical protein